VADEAAMVTPVGIDQKWKMSREVTPVVHGDESREIETPHQVVQKRLI